MKINVKHIAKLANLSLTAEEEEKYSEQLSKILGYVDQLNEVDTSNVEPTFNITPNQNVMREDKIAKSLSQEEALSNAPQKKNGFIATSKNLFIVTKGVFKEG